MATVRIHICKTYRKTFMSRRRQCVKLCEFLLWGRNLQKLQKMQHEYTDMLFICQLSVWVSPGGKGHFSQKSEKKCRRQGCFLLGWENETSRRIRTSPAVLLQNPPCAVLLLDALSTCLGYPSPWLLLSLCSPSFSPKQQPASSALLPMQGKDCYSQTCSCMKILVAILKITTGVDYASLLYYFTSTLYSLLRRFIWTFTIPMLKASVL